MAAGHAWKVAITMQSLARALLELFLRCYAWFRELLRPFPLDAAMQQKQKRHAVGPRLTFQGDIVWQAAEDRSFGVFASADVPAGCIVERCYCQPLLPSELPGTLLRPWLFDRRLGGDEALLFSFGWGLLYNETPAGGGGANVAWEYDQCLDVSGDEPEYRIYITLFTKEAVSAGTELCVPRMHNSSSGHLRDLLGHAIQVLDKDSPCVLPTTSEWKQKILGSELEPNLCSLSPYRSIEVRRSRLHGNGVFATRAIKQGEVIEISPDLILLPERELQKCLEDYQFAAVDANQAPSSSAVKVCLGFASIYNHGQVPNVGHRPAMSSGVAPATRFTTWYFAARDISSGEELLIDYGPNYWTARGASFASLGTQMSSGSKE